MPKSFAARMIVGGGQVAFKHIPKLKPIDVDIDSYDEIVLRSPIWDSKGVPAIKKDRGIVLKTTWFKNDPHPRLSVKPI